MDTNYFPIRFFEPDRKEMKIVNFAFWGTVVLSFYFQAFLPFLNEHGGNVLVMLFAPLLTNNFFIAFMSTVYLAFTALLYNAVRIKLRQRNSWAQWACMAAIGAIVISFLINLITLISMGILPFVYNRISFSLITVTTVFRLFTNIALLVLSVFLTYWGREWLRAAGIVYIVSFIAGILLGEIGLFFNHILLQVVPYISMLLNLSFLLFLRLSFKPVLKTSDDSCVA